MNYVGIEGSYKAFEIALFEDQRLLESVGGGKRQASSSFLVSLQALLQAHEKTLQDLEFIAVNQGPGAFTSLRVILASLNGLAYGEKVLAGDECNPLPKLIGIDGLDALAFEALSFLQEKDYEKRENLVLIPLLNAYNNDVYYGEYTLGCDDDPPLKHLAPKGYKKIDSFLQDLVKKYPQKSLLFFGNGAFMHSDLITKTFGDGADVSFLSLETCSAEAIGKIGFTRPDWIDITVGTSVRPLYLKEQTFAVPK